ncbi:MAG: hypothetical protein R6X32_15235, partial [Chloroflexota bacterium]
TAVPQLGPYLALGQNILVVHEETAYEITGSPTDTGSQAATSDTGATPVAPRPDTVEPGDSAEAEATTAPVRSSLPLLIIGALLLVTAALFLANRFRPF